MQKRTLISFDFETNSANPDICYPVQISALAINPFTLEIIQNSEFNSFVKPDFSTNDPNTVKWHADIQSKRRGRKVTPEEILAEWEKYPEPSEVWPQFLTYLRRYHSTQERQSKFSAPCPVGYNIILFDIPISKRMHELYGDNKALWGVRDVVDVLHMMYFWLQGSADITSYSLDNLREHFGLSTANAHDALTDVKQVAEIACRFLKFKYEIAKKRNFFKDSFVNGLQSV